MVRPRAALNAEVVDVPVQEGDTVTSGQIVIGRDKEQREPGVRLSGLRKSGQNNALQLTHL